MGVVYAFAAAVQPGPFQAYLISQSLSHGWRRTILASFAPLISDGPIILLVLLILSTVPPWLLLALQCAGGVFLFYLAYGAFRTWRTYATRTEPAAESGQRSVLQAALVNFLNPNPYLGWSLVMGPLLVKGWREAPALGISLLVGFYATMILCTAAIIMFFSAARNLGLKIRRTLIGVSAIALACFGIYQLWLAALARW